MRYETVEGQLEKMLAILLGREVRKAIDAEWRDLAKAVAAKTKLEAEEMLAIRNVNIDLTMFFLKRLQQEMNCRYTYANSKSCMAWRKPLKFCVFSMPTSIRVS